MESSEGYFQTKLLRELRFHPGFSIIISLVWQSKPFSLVYYVMHTHVIRIAVFISLSRNAYQANTETQIKDNCEVFVFIFLYISNTANLYK